MMPRENPAITEFSTAYAASSIVPTWPAKTWVIAPSEYRQREVKRAGPAMYHSFFDSTTNSRPKSRIPRIGSMSVWVVLKVEEYEVFLPLTIVSSWLPLERRG